MARDVPNPNHDPDPSGDPETDAEPDADVRRDDDVIYDDWPIRGYDESDRTATRVLGTAQAGGTTGGGSIALIYDDEERTIFEADVEQTDQQLVPREESERELGPSETLGEVLEDVGDSLGLDSLSEFAEERLQSDDERTDAAAARTAVSEDDEVIEPEVSTFTRSNVSERADHDLEFSGSVTYRPAGEPDGQVYVVERDFVVTYDDAADPRTATVDVTERLLRAEEPNADRRDGDAEPLEENATRFSIELGTIETDRHVEQHVEERCEEWHESRPGPISEA